MALYSLAEFAEICGVSTGYLTMNKKRGKLVYSEHGGIDDTNLINQAFLQKRLADKEKREAEAPIESEITPTPDEQAPIIDEVESEVTIPAPIKRQALKKLLPRPSKAQAPARPPDPVLHRKFALENEKTEAQLAKLRREESILASKQAKTAGKLIPTDLVIATFQQTFKSFVDAFKNGTDNILTEVAKKARLNRNDVAELRGTIVKTINRSVDEGIEQSLKTVKNIVAEYSQLR